MRLLSHPSRNRCCRHSPRLGTRSPWLADSALSQCWMRHPSGSALARDIRDVTKTDLLVNNTGTVWKRRLNVQKWDTRLLRDTFPHQREPGDVALAVWGWRRAEIEQYWHYVEGTRHVKLPRSLPKCMAMRDWASAENLLGLVWEETAEARFWLW